MTDYSRSEAAERAGVSEDDLAHWVELGILHPAADDRFTGGEIRKAGLIRSLTDAGLPLEGLAAIMASGSLTLDFMDSSAYERFSSLSDETFGQASARTGVPVELLMLAREAEGGAVPSPDDRIRESELPVIHFIEVQMIEGFRPPAIERLLRVDGESLRRIAESEAEWWRSEVIMPSIEAGQTAEEMANPELSDRMTPLAEESVLALYRAQQHPSRASSRLGVLVHFKYRPHIEDLIAGTTRPWTTKAGQVSRQSLSFLDPNGFRVIRRQQVWHVFAWRRPDAPLLMEVTLHANTAQLRVPHSLPGKVFRTLLADIRRVARLPIEAQERELANALFRTRLKLDDCHFPTARVGRTAPRRVTQVVGGGLPSLGKRR